MAHLPGSEQWPFGPFYFQLLHSLQLTPSPSNLIMVNSHTACSLSSGNIFICTASFGLTFLDFVTPAWISHFYISKWLFFQSSNTYEMFFPLHLLQHLGSTQKPQQPAFYRSKYPCYLPICFKAEHYKDLCFTLRSRRKVTPSTVFLLIIQAAFPLQFAISTLKFCGLKAWPSTATLHKTKRKHTTRGALWRDTMPHKTHRLCVSEIQDVYGGKSSAHFPTTHQ